MSKLKIIFMGTPDIAVSCLDMLVKREDVDVCAVVTQGDKPKGRGYKLLPPPVKEYALSENIPVYQPESLKNGELTELLESVNPDLIAVVAYGKILPSYILDFPKYGCVNVHASLLPKYRGAAPIQWAVLDGVKETGVTTMLMDEGLDTGDMLVTKKITLDENETSGSLFEKMMVAGAETLSVTIDKILDGSLTRTPQNHDEMTYAVMITKEFSYIDWSKSADEISRLVRGLNPAPGAKTMCEGKILKIYMAMPLEENSDKEKGTVVIDDDVMKIVCGDGKMIKVTELQPEGKKRMSTSDYLKGNVKLNGVVLGKGE